jgi:hypothetical protein
MKANRLPAAPQDLLEPDEGTINLSFQGARWIRDALLRYQIRKKPQQRVAWGFAFWAASALQ